MLLPKENLSPSLKEVQELIQQLVSSAEPVQNTLKKIGQALPVKPSKTLQAHERVQIYADMYFARLHDSLLEDFPKVAAIVGEENFTQLIQDYLRVCPPQTFSLRYVGEAFADFLWKQNISLQYPFLSELARFEQSLIVSFDAADAKVLTQQFLQNVPAESWHKLHFQLVPAASLKSFRWQTDLLWERAASLRCTEQSGLLGATHLLIWRKDFEVKYRRLDPFEVQVLPLIQQGIEFAELCEKASAVLATEEAVLALGTYVHKWLNEELLVLLEG